LLGDRSLCLAACGMAFYLLGSLLGILQSWPPISRVTDLTFYGAGVQGLMVYGFMGMMILAVAYEAVPRLVPGVFGDRRRMNWVGVIFLLGAFLHAIPLVLGGVAQGKALADPTRLTFMDAFGPGLMALRMSTLGDLLLVVAAFGYAATFGLGLLRAVRGVCGPFLLEALRPQTAEVRS